MPPGPVAYLGFQKGGGGKCYCWLLMLTQRGSKPSFPIFYYVKKHFWSKGGVADLANGYKYATALAPSEYATVKFDLTVTDDWQMLTD